MTIYEQIQAVLDWIEQNPASPIDQKSAAHRACMSSRSFQNYFWILTGYSFKEYLVKRRLARSLEMIRDGMQIVTIAFECGYLSHEAYTRAFKKEFSLTPSQFKSGRQRVNFAEKIILFEEMYMGVIIKKLPELNAVRFEGVGEEPELSAKEQIQEWKDRNPLWAAPVRCFGHDVEQADSSHGYRMYITSESPEFPRETSIDSGTFAVTGIEGSFESDPEGKWIKAGWDRMMKMIRSKGYAVKTNGRWFEEELEPSKPGNLRLDLYLEIE